MASLVNNKLNPPLFIGTEFYHTVDELLRDFKPTKELPLEILKKYFAMGADKPEKNTLEEKELKPLLEKRINVLEDNHRLETDNSLTGNRKRTIIEGLNDLLKTFDEPAEPSKTLINKNELIYQLYKTLYGIVNTEEITPGMIDVKQDFEAIADYLKSLTPDEAIEKAAEATVGKIKSNLYEKLQNKNALVKFVNSNSNSSTPTTSKNETKTQELCKLEDKAKRNIIKLFTLFQTQKIITDAEIKDISSNELTTLLQGVLNQEDPTIARNIRLAYRSIIRFYRDQYLRAMTHMQGFFKKSYDPKTADPNNGPFFPIDPMVRVIYIMNELERFVNKEGTDPKFNFFPTNEGLIRLLDDGKDPKFYASIVQLVLQYKAYTKTLGLKNEVDPATSKDDINYQLINMHTSPGPRKGILQLICGADINYDLTVLETKITDVTEQLGTRQNFQTLRTLFDTFFDKKDTTLYIIYQNAPIELLKKKEVKIKQLDELECLVTNVHSLQLNENAEPTVEKPKPEGAYNILQLLSKDKLKPPKIKNTFSEFGITIKDKPYQLVQSITQLTGSLQLATYMDLATFYRKTTK
jgi:hypothetical protein